MEPRPFAFHKMEALLKQMQDPESGVPVRSQKVFLTSIPSAFTGYDLIEWLMEHLNIEESGEAVHLANQLCQYGYLFPVTDCKTLSVKDDNSLYRFQAAYYWPWHHRNPDNIEYAIYLVKRTMRNKQRHALEEYEVEALTSLKKNLQNKWDLITMQAEEQAEEGNIIPKQFGASGIKVGKERKKMEKLVADSQERAYWRVHRPPPGCQHPMEPAPISSLRKNTSPPSHNNELEILRRQVSRSRIKVSQAVESLVTYSNTYSEFDPIITQPQPSNPWLSDDPAFWQFNLPLVEIPTEKRVKRWGLSFEDLLTDPSGVEEFTNYLRKEYSHENIRFWLAVKELRHCSQSQVAGKVNSIYQEFLAKGAPCEINIDSKTLETTLNELKTPSRFTFDVAAHHVYAVLLKKDCYPRFVRSEQYKTLLANALHPPTKKRFFVFGGGGKKKSSAPGPVQSITLMKRRGSDRSLTGITHETPPFASQASVPLSSSQANLHDSSTKDTGASPDKTVVPLEDSKDYPTERKVSEDKLVTEALCPPSLLKISPTSGDEGVSSDLENQGSREEPVIQAKEEPVKIKLETDTTPSKVKETSNPEGNVSQPDAPKCDPSLEPAHPSEVGKHLVTQVSEEGRSEASKSPEHLKSSEKNLEDEIKKKEGLRKVRKEGRKTRLLSEEMRRNSEERIGRKQSFAAERSVVSVDDNGCRACTSDLQPQVLVPGLAGDPTSQEQLIPSRQHQQAGLNPTDICPWEDEESCKTEETFVKKYATLGYL